MSNAPETDAGWVDLGGGFHISASLLNTALGVRLQEVARRYNRSGDLLERSRVQGRASDAVHAMTTLANRLLNALHDSVVLDSLENPTVETASTEIFTIIDRILDEAEAALPAETTS